MESVINYEKKQGTLTAKFWQVKKINAFPLQNRMRVLFSGFYSQSAAESAPESELTQKEVNMKYFKTESNMLKEAQKILDEENIKVEENIDNS